MMAASLVICPTSGMTLGEILLRRGVSRRALLKYASYLGALMALPAAATQAFAEGLASARRQSIIWLSFQECAGCTESLTRSFSPTFENLIFDLISLDYHHMLQAACGEAAEEARLKAMAENRGKYVVVVDGAVAAKDGGVYSTIAGVANLDLLKEMVKGRAGGRGVAAARDPTDHPLVRPLHRMRGARRRSERKIAGRDRGELKPAPPDAPARGSDRSARISKNRLYRRFSSRLASGPNDFSSLRPSLASPRKFGAGGAVKNVVIATRSVSRARSNRDAPLDRHAAIARRKTGVLSTPCGGSRRRGGAAPPAHPSERAMSIGARAISMSWAPNSAILQLPRRSSARVDRLRPGSGFLVRLSCVLGLLDWNEKP
jgi:hypothetical protein